ncbi:hypothetical protein QUF80_21185, partial [Desulfococcaceae bacterium HSG8]|nr:hypothetical protein [Desulfococcaceae bacterium HSG8]
AMGYALIAGDREKAIGDLYLYNPTDEDDNSYGGNLLIGRQMGRVYLSANVGMNYADTDADYIEDQTLFWGLTFEYQMTESLTSYIEFINNENKNRENYPSASPCYDEDTDEDIREVGFGITGIKGAWGIKLHAGAGLTSTSPDFRFMTSVNRGFSF